MITGLYGVAKNKIAMVTLSLNAYWDYSGSKERVKRRGVLLLYGFLPIDLENYGRLIITLFLLFLLK
jgi:hypothetical protein